MTLSITDVAEATGLRPSALRYYEDAGLITPSARQGGKRHYDPDVLGRLAIVAMCQDAGMTIAEIRDLLGHSDSRRRWRGLAETKLVELSDRIARLQAMRKHLEAALACDCSRLEGCGVVDAAAARRRPAAVSYGSFTRKHIS